VRNIRGHKNEKILGAMMNYKCRSILSHVQEHSILHGEMNISILRDLDLSVGME